MSSANPESRGYQFGWFKGVYTPSALTIFGVIMYLRFGWVLGNVGLPATLLIVLVANAIIILTALSLSALATNMKIAGGGAYFMISRSLGVEAGAAIGLPLFLAQTLGISFYVAGFSESLSTVLPHTSPAVIGVITLLGITLLAYLSANLALKSQFLIMTVIALSLIAFFSGGPPSPIEPGELSAAPARLPFWAVFAVFFPAVTGIEAGISMSGDLKNPARALPLGTLAACASGLLVYLAIPVVLALRVQDPDLLLVRPLIMRDIARWGDLILLGVWGASLSSAMGAMLGAPRTLQALSKDQVAPRLFGRGFGKNNIPRMATFFCFLIALAGILAGGLNVIGPILSMFFLTSYGFLNLSAGLETLIGNPSWRPRFRVHWALSLMGAVACLGAMLMIDAGATLVAVAVCTGLYAIMKRRRLRARWGDLRSGIMMLAVRASILRLAHKPTHEKSWKPNLLVLSGLPTKRPHLVAMADAIAQEKSLVTFAVVLPESTSVDRVRSAQELLHEHFKRQQIQALVKIVSASDTLSGCRELITYYGFGPLVPNTILLGVTEAQTRFTDYARLILLINRQQRNLVIVREPERDPAPQPGNNDPESVESGWIDVWWRGKGPNASLMLTLAHLLSRTPEWADSSLRLNVMIQNADERESTERYVGQYIREARLDATPRIVVSEAGKQGLTVIREHSRDARLVFLGLRTPEADEDAERYGQYYEEMLHATENLPLTAMVLAGEAVEFHRILA